MPHPVAHDAAPSIAATALVIDLRSFTPNLNQAGQDERGVNRYCHFLSDFYARCLKACLAALPPHLRTAPPLHLSSTGDGVLVVFYDVDRHPFHALLAALVLHHVLDVRCDRYNREHTPGMPTSFGIGVESGHVYRVRALPHNALGAPVVDAFIGDCVNRASRIEGVTKQLDRARCILGPALNQELVRILYDADYAALARASEGRADDATRLDAQDRMVNLNRELCLSYLHKHRLKGVEQPLALFRLSESSAELGNARFETLLEDLTEGDEVWLAQLRAVLDEADRALERVALAPPAA